MTSKFKVTFLSRRRMAQCEPNPEFPNGRDIDTKIRPACKVDIPYPAECVGTWIIYCDECKSTIGVTAAGRPDDPKSIMFPCKGKQLQ